MAAKRHKGRLVVVQIGPRYFVKMYEDEAIAKGLLKTGDRGRGTGQRPMALGTALVRVEPAQLETAQPDDFTEIVGIGKATDQALHENGIHTFEQLLDADVSFLSKQGQKAVEEWRRKLIGDS
jgi:hypothetical protein